MRAHLIHDHVRALLHLMLIFMKIGHGFAHAFMFIQRSIVVMLMLPVRQCSFFLRGYPNGCGSLTGSFA
jgi:hypothetical protein